MSINKAASLPKNILQVVRDKGTEHPFTGEYNDFGDSGTYLCRQCGSALFRSKTKFHSSCGWPSFDEEIPNAVEQVLDADGRRIEIICKTCHAHLGHVFQGEYLTPKNTRHCVNSLSLDFVEDANVLKTEEAIFAAGCFWGVEHYFKQLKGVVKTQVGYSGGSIEQPSYEAICRGNTGHYEVIRVIYDPTQIDYASVVKFFFEIHDPTQANGQGPDIGQQYLSVVFYYNEQQKMIATEMMKILQEKGLELATQLLPVKTFWQAEGYHQDYYEKTGRQPYCHHYTKRF